MDTHLIAYMAGVMDSDGWFTIKRHAANSRYGSSFTYSEFAGCGQTSPEAVELLQGTFGGSIRIRRRETAGDWKPMHYWVVSNKLAAEVARVLQPYLRIKAEHAALILLIRESKENPADRRARVKTALHGRALRPEVTAARHDAYTRIRSLNDRRVRA